MLLCSASLHKILFGRCDSVLKPYFHPGTNQWSKDWAKWWMLCWSVTCCLKIHQNFHIRKKNCHRCQKFTKHYNPLTLELSLSLNYKSGSTSFQSKDVTSCSSSCQFRNSCFMLALLTNQSPRALPLILQAKPLMLLSGIAVGSNVKMTCRGWSIERLISAAWPTCCRGFISSKTTE